MIALRVRAAAYSLLGIKCRLVVLLGSSELRIQSCCVVRQAGQILKRLLLRKEGIPRPSRTSSTIDLFELSVEGLSHQITGRRCNPLAHSRSYARGTNAISSPPRPVVRLMSAHREVRGATNAHLPNSSVSRRREKYTRAPVYEEKYFLASDSE